MYTMYKISTELVMLDNLCYKYFFTPHLPGQVYHLPWTLLVLP